MKYKDESQNYRIAINFSGWGASICLGIFFLNITVGKIMHITKFSVNAPIDGPAEFLLLALVIVQFSICVLLKELIEPGAEK